ncbi:ammonium transporter Rh type B [Ornithorhynchus anatinus]|uniref:Ammonium transporter Rh type B n=1 Tax=Ornithorhynchus anatinus TaxID=9258 RepID=A0A6I8P9Q9_ORNAN|nr:ammonium transporter Rh type B [Ornithorhynchus anatinus]
MGGGRPGLRLASLLVVLEASVLGLFGLLVRSGPDRAAASNGTSADGHAQNDDFYRRYPSFQDAHVMIFVGFGFLMSFLQRYGYSAVGFNLLLAACSLQWATLVQGLVEALRHRPLRVLVSVQSMINADFAAGAVLISWGAVLGKVSPVQLLLMAIAEVTIFAANEFVVLHLLGARDGGGSMTIHAFGAYFGLIVSRFLYRPQLAKSRHRARSVYHSDLFAMIGSLFLWIFWPSFNSATAQAGAAQHRSALNTYYALTASTVTTFATSVTVSREGRLDMVHVQNAALAGGVAVGTAAEMMVTPFGALAVGAAAGAVATLGYRFLTPLLESGLRVQDTCGVHNLHGLPGLLGALLGAGVATRAGPDTYGDRLDDVFPLVAGGHRSAWLQGGYQLCGLLVTLATAVVGGSLVGLLLRLPCLVPPPDALCFEDQIYWELPAESEEDAGPRCLEPVLTEDPGLRA